LNLVVQENMLKTYRNRTPNIPRDDRRVLQILHIKVEFDTARMKFVYSLLNDV